MTLQAVWPRELRERRALVIRLQSEIVRLGNAPDPAALADLRHQLESAPCPHWDLVPPGLDGTAWQCEECAELIAADWVPLQAQANAVRRALPRFRLG